MFGFSKKTVQKVLVVVAACYLLTAVLSPGGSLSKRGLTSKEVDRKKHKARLEQDFDDERVRSLKKEKNFNYINPHQEWCPSARCSNSAMCSPCDRRFLFIIGTGRSGTTTLMHLFDNLPDVRMAGENWGELNIAADLETNLEKGWFRYNQMGQGPFRHNPIHEQALACVHQHLVRALNPPSRWMQHFSIESVDQYDSKTILGMTTIRIHEKGWTPRQAARYFKHNFPCARFLINIRSDKEAQKRSVMKFFKIHDDEEIKRIVVDGSTFLQELAEYLGPESAMFLDMDQWRDNISSLNRVLSWMGFTGCKFDGKHKKHPSNYEKDEFELDMGRSCKYPFL